MRTLSAPIAAWRPRSVQQHPIRILAVGDEPTYLGFDRRALIADDYGELEVVPLRELRFDPIPSHQRRPVKEMARR